MSGERDRLSFGAATRHGRPVPLVKLVKLTKSLCDAKGMSTVTLTREEARYVAQLAAARPGVSKHRVGRALFRLGRRVESQQPEALDDELGEMGREAERRCRSIGDQPTEAEEEVEP